MNEENRYLLMKRKFKRMEDRMKALEKVMKELIEIVDNRS